MIRWKKDYPEFFKKVQDGNPDPRKKIVPKTKVFEQCSASKSFTEWFEKQEPYVRSFFQWPTNQYDIR